MQYEIHGKPVMLSEECGMYKDVFRGISMDYAEMYPNLLVQAINGMPIHEAIEAVTALRDQVAEQVKWEHTPQNIGYPILQQRPGPTPIDEVRDNIANTERFCNDVLRALQGE